MTRRARVNNKIFLNKIGRRPNMSLFRNTYLPGLAQNGAYDNNVKYKRKYNNLKRTVKSLVMENAALCDQVSEIQENIAVVKEERRFLLRKLMEFEGDSETHHSGYRNSVSPSTSYSDPHVTPIKKSKKRPSIETQAPNPPSKSRRAKAPAKRLVQSIPLDSMGRPIFPICLGGLTIHSFGEVISDKALYHTEDLIFPVGFVSTRVYGSLRDPLKKSVYTCKISDGGNSPLFEIVADSDQHSPIRGTSPNHCHSILLQQINLKAKVRNLSTTPKGAKFFGLSHPTILNLIQSSMGARKCTSYKWSKFEVSKSGEVYNADENDPTINFEKLQRCIMLHTMPEVKEEPPDDILDNSESR